MTTRTHAHLSALDHQAEEHVRAGGAGVHDRLAVVAVALTHLHYAHNKEPLLQLNIRYTASHIAWMASIIIVAINVENCIDSISDRFVHVYSRQSAPRAAPCSSPSPPSALQRKDSNPQAYTSSLNIIVQHSQASVTSLGTPSHGQIL